MSAIAEPQRLSRPRTDEEQRAFEEADRQWQRNWLRSFTGLYEDLCYRYSRQWARGDFLRYALLFYGVPREKMESVLAMIDKRVPQARHVDDSMIG